jgi:hypothetical protein
MEAVEVELANHSFNRFASNRFAMNFFEEGWI